MTLEIVMRKLLLGDENEKQVREERGIPAANHRAQSAAERQGLCSCRRSDGIICGRPLEGKALCWPCWANYKDGKPCVHQAWSEGSASDA